MRYGSSVQTNKVARLVSYETRHPKFRTRRRYRSVCLPVLSIYSPGYHVGRLASTHGASRPSSIKPHWLVVCFVTCELNELRRLYIDTRTVHATSTIWTICMTLLRWFDVRVYPRKVGRRLPTVEELLELSSHRSRHRSTTAPIAPDKYDTRLSKALLVNHARCACWTCAW